jgi:dihydroflavonol-4-reductase
MSENILVTGASGFLGGNLARLLIEGGQSSRILARPTSNLSCLADLPGWQRVEGDITQPESLAAALEGVDVVYHCAARVEMPRFMTPAIWEVNVEGTENLLQACRKAGVRRLVYCSTVDALGLPEGDQPSDESTPWNWDRLGVENAYSKYEAHRRVEKAAATGLDAVLVCPTFMLGAYDPRPTSGRLIQQAARSPLRVDTGGGNNFVDVLDVASAMISAAECGRRGETYILGGQNLPYAELQGLIHQALGRKAAPGLRLPYWILSAAGWLGDAYETLTGRSNGLNTPMARLSSMRHYYDSSKAVRELGLQRSPLPAALARAVGWLHAAGML